MELRLLTMMLIWSLQHDRILISAGTCCSDIGYENLMPYRDADFPLWQPSPVIWHAMSSKCLGLQSWDSLKAYNVITCVAWQSAAG